MASSDEPRHLVWHYTDIGGLRGILSSGRLRLGNVRFLNDRTEFTFGWQIVSEILAGSQSASVGGLFDFAMVKDDVDRCVETADFFVCSFSAKCDVISQWQRYAAVGHGYCLGFDFADFVKFGPQDNSISLRRVIYSPQDQQQAVEADLATAERNLAARLSNADDEGHAAHLISQASMELVRTLAERCVTLKNPDFADEDEWRLIRAVGDNEELATVDGRVCIHASGNYLKPCIDADVTALWRRDMTEHRLPLRVVVCGPQLQADLAVQSVNYALKAHSFGKVEARASALTSWR